MSIGLALRKIAEYTVRYDQASSKVNFIQQQLQWVAMSAAANGGKEPDPKATERLRKELAIAMFLQGLFKDFTEFWKQVIKEVRELLKSLSELASSSR